MLKRFKPIIMAMLMLVLYSADAQQITFDPSIGGVQTMVDRQNAALDNLKNSLCQQVDQASQDVTKLPDGTMSYPNWIRFVQLANFIDSLNTIWNDAYGDALNQVIDRAISSGATNATQSNEQSKDFLSDIIEDQYLQQGSDWASICYEKKFNFVSLRKCFEDREDNWLGQQTGSSVDYSQSPELNEELDDEEYWTLITCGEKGGYQGYHIEDPNITATMLAGMDADAQRSIIDILKDIVPIIQGIVQVGEELHKLFADCAGTATASVSNKKDGFRSRTMANKWIGYKIVQKGVFIDFANTTTTKIKGKAYVSKEKSNGKLKKDKRTVIGVGFCLSEWNNCQNEDFPVDYPNPYKDPRVDKRKKAKTIKKFPMALTIKKSGHFLQFKFGLEGIFEQALNLFGSNGCVTGSNTDW